MRRALNDLLTTLSTVPTLAAAFAVIAPFSSAWAQCSVCQAALANSEGGGQLIGGFQQGIVLMFAVMGVLGAIGWGIARRARAEFRIRQSQHSGTATATNSCLPAENPASR